MVMLGVWQKKMLLLFFAVYSREKHQKEVKQLLPVNAFGPIERISRVLGSSVKHNSKSCQKTYPLKNSFFGGEATVTPPPQGPRVFCWNKDRGWVSGGLLNEKVRRFWKNNEETHERANQKNIPVPEKNSTKKKFPVPEKDSRDPNKDRGWVLGEGTLPSVLGGGGSLLYD